MCQTTLFTWFCVAVLSTAVSGSCDIGSRYGGEWDGVQDHTYRTEDNLEIQGSDVIGSLNDVTTEYKCEESDEYETFFLLLTHDKASYNCLRFHIMMDSMVQYTVVTKNGSFEPIEIPEDQEVTFENLCMNEDMEPVLDIARRL
ncbi:uncharacterized protein LOC117329552 isoform X2 [Pecten maximus]|uniref:uncharacterized protein LOC117329552 isoform X2 n=1 Tax=Pecten maximus TaxID=6579 RepID=UPI001458501C|nr:uncharacterized protein LOC117329552 isoform X2 [Pecten maximus]